MEWRSVVPWSVRLALATVVLAASACATVKPPVPVPEGRDWHFVASGYRSEWVSVSRSLMQAGGRTVTTTTTSASTVPAMIVGAARAQALPLRDLGNRGLLRRHPESATQPFRPLSELP